MKSIPRRDCEGAEAKKLSAVATVLAAHDTLWVEMGSAHKSYSRAEAQCRGTFLGLGFKL